MQPDAINTADHLAEFDRRQTREGLLRRYASGRVAHFFNRQIMTVAGAVTLAFVISLPVGLVALFAALMGEIVDCLLLCYVPGYLRRSVPERRLYFLTAITAGFQAMTISFCMIMALALSRQGAGDFFIMAFLIGAAINAGITLPFHRAATWVRLAVYITTVCGIFVYKFGVEQNDAAQQFYFELVGATIMIYIVALFIGYVNSTTRTHAHASRALIVRQMEISQTYRDLHLKERETRKLALVAELANDSVVICDSGGRINWVNQAFTKITGYSEAEAIGQRPNDLLDGPDTDDATSDQIRLAATAGRAHRTEILNYTKDGRKIWIETNLVPVMDDTGVPELTVAIERDITQAKLHEQKLAEARLAAEQSDRAKSEFLSTMSHEIRTPMNGIIGMSDLLCEANLPKEPRQYADTIRSSAEALLNIINDILDLAKLNAGKFEITPEAFSLHDCLGGAVGLLRLQAQEKGLALDLALDSDLPKTMRGDDGRIRQIMVNLIGNAIKFTKTGRVQIQVSHNSCDQGHRVEIKVTDTGIGIAAHQLTHIFDQFSQADATTTRHFGGTGLGLTISRLLARRMGGDIAVTSKAGAGSCFTLTLALGRVTGKATAAKPARATPNGDQIKGMRVLVAEDNRTNRLLIEKYLKDQPICLTFANNGREAVEQVRADPPDLVFMDISMPEMDGLEATVAIRASDMPQPVIVALTANAFDTDRKACLNAGMDDYLTKPIRRADLLNALACHRTAGAPDVTF